MKTSLYDLDVYLDITGYTACIPTLHGCRVIYTAPSGFVRGVFYIYTALQAAFMVPVRTPTTSATTKGSL